MKVANILSFGPVVHVFSVGVSEEGLGRVGSESCARLSRLLHACPTVNQAVSIHSKNVVARFKGGNQGYAKFKPISKNRSDGDRGGL